MYEKVTGAYAIIMQGISDFSAGMVATAKEVVGKYDNIDKGLSEVRCVLKTSGVFYCATYGEYGMFISHQ